MSGLIVALFFFGFGYFTAVRVEKAKAWLSRQFDEVWQTLK